MSVSGILAITNQTTNGELSTGIVDIKIQNYKIDNNMFQIYAVNYFKNNINKYRNSLIIDIYSPLFD